MNSKLYSILGLLVIVYLWLFAAVAAHAQFTDGVLPMQPVNPYSALADGLVAAYPMEEGTGSVVHDLSGRLASGSLENSALWAPDLGGAVDFEMDTSDYIELPSNPYTIADAKTYGLSFSAWIKPERATIPSGTEYPGILGGRGDVSHSSFSAGGIRLIMGTSYATAQMVIYDGSYPAATGDSGDALSADQWYHIVGIYDPFNSEIRVYLNAALIGTQGVTNSDITFEPVVYRIGNAASGASTYFDGRISRCLTWRRVLALSEIRQLYADPDAWRRREPLSLYVFGEAGDAWEFDEDDSHYVSVADNAALTLPDADWSMGGWIKCDDNTGSDYQYIISWNYGNNSSVEFLLGETTAGSFTSDFAVRVKDADGDNTELVSTSDASDSTDWQHVMIVRSGSTYTFYLDGAQAATDTDATIDAVDAAAAFEFGRRDDGGPDRGFDGRVAYWAKWDEALNTTEIGYLADGYYPDSYSDNLAWYIDDAAGYTESIVPLSITNNGSTLAEGPTMIAGTPPSGYYQVIIINQ